MLCNHRHTSQPSTRPGDVRVHSSQLWGTHPAAATCSAQIPRARMPPQARATPRARRPTPLPTGRASPGLLRRTANALQPQWNPQIKALTLNYARRNFPRSAAASSSCDSTRAAPHSPAERPCEPRPVQAHRQRASALTEKTKSLNPNLRLAQIPHDRPPPPARATPRARRPTRRRRDHASRGLFRRTANAHQPSVRKPKPLSLAYARRIASPAPGRRLQLVRAHARGAPLPCRQAVRAPACSGAPPLMRISHNPRSLRP